MKKNGFTLIELLVVIAIIAILTSMLFPVFGQARAKARQTACQSNLRQIAMAFIQYTNDYDGQFPPVVPNTTALGGCWTSRLMPYVKSEKIFACPSDDSKPYPDNESYPYGNNINSYAYNGWLSGLMLQLVTGDWNAPTDVGTPIGSVDQPSKIVLIFDKETEPGNDTGGYNSTMATPYYALFFGMRYDWLPFRHDNGQNYAFVDGHVKWIKVPADVCDPNAPGDCFFDSYAPPVADPQDDIAFDYRYNP